MRALSASELLAVWERGQASSAVQQALILLAAASPDAPPETLAKLSVGRRDARLLELREELFGSRLLALAGCPQCGQQIELSFETAEIRADADSAPPDNLTISSGHYIAEFRLVNSEDLAAVADLTGEQAGVAAATQMLLSRCLLKVRLKGRRQTVARPGDLPPALVATIAEEMEKADPQANVQLDLVCGDCGHRWLSPFDIVSFLWTEIDSWARRLLREVCLLASVFGWREADILAMSPERRSLYLEMMSKTVVTQIHCGET